MREAVRFVEKRAAATTQVERRGTARLLRSGGVLCTKIRSERPGRSRTRQPFSEVLCSIGAHAGSPGTWTSPVAQSARMAVLTEVW